MSHIISSECIHLFPVSRRFVHLFNLRRIIIYFFIILFAVYCFFILYVAAYMANKVVYILWLPCVADAVIIFLSCGFFLLSFFFVPDMMDYINVRPKADV